MVFAQPKCKIVHYSTENGLSHDNVTCITKDEEGFMWFGTFDGINRFDGHTFKKYKSKQGDSSVLQNNRIDKIVEGKNGFLWLRAYDYQVYRFDKKHESFYAVTPTLKQGAFKYNFSGIKVTKEGDVWLTTEKNGIFYSSNPDDPKPVFTHLNTLPGAKGKLKKTTFLYQNKDHDIWLGTPQGLFKIIKNKKGTISLAGITNKEIASAGFNCYAEDKKFVFFGTNNGYLVTYNKAKKSYKLDKVSSSPIKGISKSKKNEILYATTSASELITFWKADGKHEAIHINGDGGLNSVREDSYGMLWLEPQYNGVIRFDPETKKYKLHNQLKEPNSLTTKRTFRVYEDNNGVVWVDMKGGGFGYYDAGKDRVEYFFNGPDPVTHRFSNMVNKMLYDKNGILWMSTYERGLEKVIFQANDFNPSLLDSTKSSRAANEVRGLFTDRAGRVWLAAKSGKLYLKTADGNTKQPIFKNKPDATIGQVYCITQDHTGAIWLGTKSHGLYRAVPTDANEITYTIEHFLNKPNDPYSLSSNQIYSVYQDKQQRVWVGTFDKGLNLIQYAPQIRFLSTQNHFKNYPEVFNKIRHISEDSYGHLWIGTTNGLMLTTQTDRVNNQFSFQTYSKIPGDMASLPNNDIQFVYRDATERMWIATSGGGISVVKSSAKVAGMKFKTFSTANGLPNDYIMSCMEDAQNNMWITTQMGLTRFNIKQNIFKSFDSDDGLPDVRFSEASCTKMSNGNMVFGTIAGYIEFSPESIKDEKIPADLFFTNFQVNNKDISTFKSGETPYVAPNFIQKLQLNHDQNTIKIEFTTLDYRSENKPHYVYRLRDFEQSWRDNQNQRNVTYTNLPPGRYLFEVKCINDDMYSTTPQKTLEIIISPPYWKTWWAYAIYTILILALLEFGRRTLLTMLRLRHRIAVEQKLAELKMNFFTNISHELRTPLTLILNPIEEISSKEVLSEQGQFHASLIRQNANRMVRFINQLLDLRKVQSGKAKLKISQVSMVGFINQIMGYFAESAKAKGLTLRFEHTGPEVSAWIDAEKIDIVIFNLIANAVKFSRKNSVITIILSNVSPGDLLLVEVRDEGPGVEENQLQDIFELYYEGEQRGPGTTKGTGIGLALSKELVLLHHGKISAANVQPRGLSVKVELMKGKAHFNHEEAEVIDMPALDSLPVTQELLNWPVFKDVSVEGASLPKLLLVEDNGELRTFLQQQLSSYYQVSVAENGEEGLQQIEADAPDIIVSDVMMPVMDGIGLLDRIKNDCRFSHIPVVLLSARYSVEHQIEGLKYGADLYITKPFQIAFLLAAVENLLKQRRKLFDRLTETEERQTVKLAPGELVVTSKDEKFLKDVIRIVEENMENPEFGVHEIYELIGMGRSNFHAKFKSLTNLPPVEFVRDMRLKRAKQYLDAGETNISTVAYTIGFNNAKYFSTCFREKYQITPSEYLKSNKLNSLGN